MYWLCSLFRIFIFFNISDNFALSSNSDSSPCLRGLSDHLPNHLLDVFLRPKNYLEGPLATRTKTKQKHFIIVGGGMAGLTSAFLLLQVGHKVTLLESSQRIGGRVFTHYGDGWYGDLGAMRFPPSHHILHGVFKHMKIPVTRFTNTFETESSYLFLGGKYYGVPELGLKNKNSSFNGEKLWEVYKLFNVSNPPQDEAGKLLNVGVLWDEILTNKVDLGYLCKNDRSLAAFLREGLEEKKQDPNLMNVWAILHFMRPFLGHSVLEFLMDSNQKEMEKAEHEHKHFVEIVNGSSVLPDTIFKELLHFKNFQYMLGSHVGEISDNSNTVSVSVTDKDGLKTITADFVIVTPTAREIDQMKFSPPLPYMKKHALDGLEYFGSVKILLKFKSPFWADKNSIPSIKYGDKNSVNGASAVSDDILRMTYYPSNDLHGPSILASYTWEQDAEIFLSMSDEECIQKALDILEERHGSVVQDSFETGVVKKWQLDNHAHGAFVIHDVYQRNDFTEYLMAPHGRVIFSGEYANKFHNGWIESALESAIRNLVSIWPTQFQQKFGKAEKEFFKRNQDPPPQI